MSNIAKVRYSKVGKDRIIIHSFDNLLTQKEILEMYGPEVAWEYYRSTYRAYRTQLNGVEIKNRIFSPKLHSLNLSYTPCLVTKEYFTDLINYLRLAGAELRRSIRSGRDKANKIASLIHGEEKVLEI